MLTKDSRTRSPPAEGGSWHQALPGHSFFHTADYYGRLNVGYLAVLGSQPP